MKGLTSTQLRVGFLTTGSKGNSASPSHSSELRVHTQPIEGSDFPAVCRSRKLDEIRPQAVLKKGRKKNRTGRGSSGGFCPRRLMEKVFGGRNQRKARGGGLSMMARGWVRDLALAR